MHYIAIAMYTSTQMHPQPISNSTSVYFVAKRRLVQGGQMKLNCMPTQPACFA